MAGFKRLPAARPHLPMLMGMVFGRLRARLAVDAPALRPSQLRVLEWLPPEGLTISVLAECTEMTTQGCGQFVRQLEALGMVDVAVADHDARARVVRVTEAGRDALARAGAVLAACDEAWAAQVGPERWRVFREVLEEVALG
ncbi:MarR family winged helix-turn-helix transcriptional regulator [Nocardioides pinisoli]|uniref:MarR family winged helix-turn-helix transcriptional regulator n=1 Tax=Nocardioides pinisoli TaxID=2950279 RepID=A0ABT1KYZ6_9ACTN|nr:MarR family winged helix-turn-helix transcriptional regulator [Nocardioides pinisoli]MCP3422574.1 MarR family winged helix-turn-helix transcriptional regulator [Nocardioides pinisoli]